MYANSSLRISNKSACRRNVFEETVLGPIITHNYSVIVQVHEVHVKLQENTVYVLA